MLRGELVTLRAVEADDYERLAVFANDVEVELLGGGDPPTPRSRASVTAFWGRMSEQGAVSFGITADDRLIGICGLSNIDAVSHTAALGITIGEREYWGRGYGRDAVRLLVDYGFRMRNLRKMWLTVHGTNTRAIRAYEAVGFVEEGRQRAQVWSDGEFVDLVFMGLIRTPGR
jgi:RimJ/RimL family protein N-acetyltransferase